MHQHSCLICGEPIIYTNKAVEMECINCHKKFLSHTKCVNEHFVCDQCHGSEALLVIKYECNKADSKNPIEIAMHLMKSPTIHMHGPEHHTLVGAALLTAYYNSGGKIDLNNYLEEMARRGGQVPGGICGLWGSCGAAVSSGIFTSIITKSTPLSTDTWGLCNLMTSAVLKNIGEIGGPRCCKRNSFTAIKTVVGFVEEHFGIKMELPKEIKCSNFSKNKECLGTKCPYYF